MQAESYSVKAPGFEGPLDLLLDLIEKRKLHISDVSLSQVTDDFIAYIKDRGHFPLGLSAHFILVASTLLLIKSKSLLPTLELTLEEETDMQDLEARLKEYQRIKELSFHVRELFGKRIIFQKMQLRQKMAVFAPDESMTAGNIALAARSVLQSLPKKVARPQITLKKVVSLEETIEKLTVRITKSLKMSFREFSGQSGRGVQMSQEDKVGVIVNFLAMLELAKQGIIAVAQERLFDDILMESEQIGVPRYN